MHTADLRADQITKDDKIQRHGDHRRNQRLDPDTPKPVNLFQPDTFQSHPIQLRHYFFSSLPFTSVTNSSSRRFALLRILNTCTPCLLSWLNREFSPCSSITSTSSVDVSVSWLRYPSSTGSGLFTPNSRMKVSDFSFDSSSFMLVFSTSWPP